MRKLEGGVVKAARQPVLGDNRSTTATNRCVGARDPDTINLNSTLDSADAERNIVLHLFCVHLLYRLRLEHLRRRRRLALVNLAVLADLAAVIPKFEETEEDCDYNAASQYLNDISNAPFVAY